MSDGFHPPLEEYLEAICELEEEGIAVIQARLAERLEHTAASVSEMIHRLRDEGFITLDGRSISLTAEGRSRAESVVRKHRLAERLLTDIIGLPWSRSHLEACRWEHVISDEVEERLVALLGDPSTCPHGNPIPGTTPDAAEQRPLSTCDVGTTMRLARVTERVEIDTEALAYLDAANLRPGADATITARAPDGTLTIEVNGSPVSLGAALTSQIYVTAGESVQRVSLGDARLAPYVGMYGSEYGPRDDGLCVVESRLAVESLLDSPYEPVSLLLAERLVDSLGELIARFPGEVLVAPQDVIDATVGFALHRGVVACARRGAPLSVDGVVSGARCLVVTECVNDPENLGALFRNAAAFGVDGMLLDPATCDALSRRVIRVSMGHALRMPFARAPLSALEGFTTIALSPDAATDVASVEAARFALLVGNEGDGLSESAMQLADVRAAIPMAKGVDSLNVATAAAVALALLARGRG